MSATIPDESQQRPGPAQRRVTPAARPTGRVQVSDGWLLVDEIKVCRVLAGGVLELKDGHKGRSAERGSPIVRVTVEQIALAVQQHLAERAWQEFGAGSERQKEAFMDLLFGLRDME